MADRIMHNLTNTHMDRKTVFQLFDDLQESLTVYGSLVSAPYLNALRDRVRADRVTLGTYFAKSIRASYQVRQVPGSYLCLKQEIGYKDVTEHMLSEISCHAAEWIVDNAKYPSRIHFFSEASAGGNTIYLYFDF
jgi:hypothetical protein